MAHIYKHLLLVILFANVMHAEVAFGQDNADPEHRVKILSIAFSPTRNTLAAVDGNNTFRVLDVASGEELKKLSLALGKDERIQSLTYSPDGDVIILLRKQEPSTIEKASGMTTQGKVFACVWNLTFNKRSPLVEIGFGGFAICPKCQLLAAGQDIWDIAAAKKIREFKLPFGLVYDIAFSPDGKTVTYRICEGLAQEGSIIVIMDLATGKKVLQIGDLIPGSREFTLRSRLEFSADGKTIAYSEPDNGSIYLRNMITGKEVKWIPETKNEQVVGFSPDGKMLFSWDRQRGTLRLWETATAKERRCLMIGADVHGMAFSPNARTVALLKGKRIEFRNLWE